MVTTFRGREFTCNSLSKVRIACGMVLLVNVKEGQMVMLRDGSNESEAEIVGSSNPRN